MSAREDILERLRAGQRMTVKVKVRAEGDPDSAAWTLRMYDVRPDGIIRTEANGSRAVLIKDATPERVVDVLLDEIGSADVEGAMNPSNLLPRHHHPPRATAPRPGPAGVGVAALESEGEADGRGGP